MTAADAACPSAPRSSTCWIASTPIEGDLSKLESGDYRRIVDLCWQCKLCYNHCPYTPPHRWQIDFPRLMLRSKAARAKDEGVTRSDRWLGNVDAVGRLGSATAPLSNWANSFAPQRALMEAVIGIDKTRNLPKFHRTTFERWFSQAGAEAQRGQPRRLLLLVLGELQRAADRARRRLRAREERVGDRLSRAGLLRDALSGRRRHRSRAAQRHAEHRLAASSGRARSEGRRSSADVLLRAQERLPGPGARRGCQEGERSDPGSVRVSRRAAQGREPRHRLRRGAPRQGRVSGSVSPPGAEHGLQDPRRPAADSGHESVRRRALHGHGRHLGDEERSTTRSASSTRSARRRRWSPQSPTCS